MRAERPVRPHTMRDLALGGQRAGVAAGERGQMVARLVRRILLYLVLGAGAAFTAFPFAWMLLTSFKTRSEALRDPPTLLPSVWHVSNYSAAWHAAPFARYFANTFLICACVVAGVAITSTLAAYAFSRIDFYCRNLLFILFLSTLMIPFETIIIPNFIIVKKLHMLNTYWALIVPWASSVFSIFLLRQFFDQLPQDLYDSAALDGAGHLRTLLTIVLPLARGPLAAVMLFAFLGSWNSLLWPLIVTNSESLRPIQLGLSVFITSDSTEPSLLMAASAFTIAPIVVLYFIAQRQFIEGFASAGLKG
ncbi:MAG TPA: carbohydrate ABC transporter permease [Dehalococcoidia bacterium]|nr:carbohydrate ABC transporter permease [Dehalococcoidia bacterium]